MTESPTIAKKNIKLKAIMLYEYLGSSRKVGEILNKNKKTITNWYSKATDEEITVARDYAKSMFEKDLAEVFSLAIGKLKDQLSIPGGVKLNVLNYIAGTMADKLIAVRGLKVEKREIEHKHSGEMTVKNYHELKEKAKVVDIDETKNRITKHLN